MIAVPLYTCEDVAGVLAKKCGNQTTGIVKICPCFIFFMDNIFIISHGKQIRKPRFSSASTLLLSRLELSDTKVYEP